MFKFRSGFSWRLSAVVAMIFGVVVTGPAAAQADVPELKIRATNSYPADQPPGKAMDHFAKRVSELSGGKMTVQVFHAGKLYTEDKSIQAVLDGTVEIGMASASNHGPFTKVWAAVETPFLLGTKGVFREVIVNGELGREIRKASEKDGLRPLFILETGGHRVVGSGKQVKVPADLKQSKIRVAQSPVILEFYRAVGANPVIVPWGETYLALANKAVDGLDAALASWPAGKLSEVAKHITTVNWAPLCTVVDANVKWWNARTPKQQEILTQAAREAEEFSMKSEDENEIALRTKLKGEGVTIYDPTPEERAQWRKVGETVWSKMPGVDQAFIARLNTAAQAVK